MDLTTSKMFQSLGAPFDIGNHRVSVSEVPEKKKIQKSFSFDVT